MGIANILRICGILFIIFAAGLFVSIHIFTDSWFVENATDEHLKDGKTLANDVSSLGIGTGVLFLLSSFINDVNSAKIILLGVSVMSLLLLVSFIFNQIIFAGSPPPPVWIIVGLAFGLSVYGRLRVNRM